MERSGAIYINDDQRNLKGDRFYDMENCIARARTARVESHRRMEFRDLVFPEHIKKLYLSHDKVSKYPLRQVQLEGNRGGYNGIRINSILEEIYFIGDSAPKSKFNTPNVFILKNLHNLKKIHLDIPEVTLFEISDCPNVEEVYIRIRRHQTIISGLTLDAHLYYSSFDPTTTVSLEKARCTNIKY